MRPSARLPSEAGVTIAEVLLAAGLLASAIVALTGLVILAVQATHASGDLTRATVFAEQALAQLQAPEGVPPAADGLERIDYLDAAGRLVPAPDAATYSRRWRVVALPGAPPGSAVLWVEIARTVTVRHRSPVTVVGIRRPAP